MSIELKMLTPAPWEVQIKGGGVVMCADNWPVADCGGDVDAEFIALARNAFDVMMRRGWTAVFVVVDTSKPFRWRANDPRAWLSRFNTTTPICDDPFTALVEADKRYRENAEHKT